MEQKEYMKEMIYIKNGQHILHLIIKNTIQVIFILQKKRLKQDQMQKRNILANIYQKIGMKIQVKQMNKIKCIKELCKFYYDSDDNYFETCQLISKYVLLDNCYGLSEIPNKKEELTCKIAKLVSELEYLNELEELIDNNQ